jgi:hypothetical protein
MVPHNSRPYRAILDLSFPVQLNPTTTVPSVNTTTTKTAPRGAIDQIGHVLPRIIHAFASVEDDAKIFMAKWDIKDGFWRLDCEAGEEWNFSYVLPPSYGSDDIKDGAWAHVKDILGMTFDGNAKTIWLATEKRDALLLVLKSWIRKASKRTGIVFNEFRTTLSKLQHAFLTVPAGRGLLSAFYQVLSKEPAHVYLHSNANLYNAVRDCRAFLRDTIGSPTRCKNLVTGWPDYVGITDASGHGLGGVIIGENKAVPPVVFRLQWPADITASIVSDDNPNGMITNSDLEMAGLLMLWLVMEEVCEVENAHVALFSDNSPTVHWVQRLAAKHSTIAMQLVRALALRLQLAKASPLTPMHIAGVNNSLTDIPSRSFGSDAAWHCKNDAQLLTLFNSTFPLPNQGSWTVFHLSSEIAMRVTSILRMKVFTADEWKRLPRKGKLTGSVGSPMSSRWEWTHTFNKRRTNTEFVPCLDLPQGCGPALMAKESKFALAQSVAQSRPLARRSLWPMGSTQPK